MSHPPKKNIQDSEVSAGTLTEDRDCLHEPSYDGGENVTREVEEAESPPSALGFMGRNPPGQERLLYPFSKREVRILNGRSLLATS